MSMVLIGATVGIVPSCSGSDTQTAPTFEADAMNQQLKQDVEALIGPGNLDQSGLVLIFTELDRAVSDMTLLSDEEFLARHGRSATDEAGLIGSLMGGLRTEYGSDQPSDEFVTAVNQSPLQLDVTGTESNRELIDAVVTSLSGRIPNEDSDNPRLAKASMLRSTMQAAFAANVP
jgi:hypothetical protein